MLKPAVESKKIFKFETQRFGRQNYFSEVKSKKLSKILNPPVERKKVTDKF